MKLFWALIIGLVLLSALIVFEGNRALNVIIRSAFFFEARGYLAILLSVGFGWAYWKLRNREELTSQFYQYPGSLTGSHILLFLITLFLIYATLPTALQISTKYLAEKKYQDKYPYQASNFSHYALLDDILGCKDVFIRIENIHSNAAFCMNDEISGVTRTDLLNNQESHLLRIRGQQNSLGISVKSLELVKK